MRAITKTIFHWQLLIFLLIMFGVGYYTADDYGYTWDEQDRIQLGERAKDYYLTFGKNKEYFSFYFQPEFYSSRGPLIDLIASLGQSLFSNNSLQFYHFELFAFNLVGVVALYFTVFDRTHNQLLAVLGSSFWIFNPILYGHFFNNSIDAGLSSLFMVQIWLGLGIVDKKNDLRRLVAFALISGMVSGMRPVMIYSFMVFSIVYLVKILLFKQQNWFAKIKKYAVVILLSIFSLYLVQPFLHQHPISGWKQMLTSSTNFPFVGDVLFNGQQISALRLPPWYIPTMILITMPIFTIVLFILGFIKSIRSLVRIKKLNFEHMSNLCLILLIIIPIIAILLKRPVTYDSWRHFLFLNAPIITISVLIWVKMICNQRKLLKYFLITIFLINQTVLALEMIALHPYQYVYYNFFVGGLPGAYGKFETDYWAASYKEQVEWLTANELSLNRNYNISVCGPHHSASYFFPPNVKLVYSVDDADYIICYTRWNNHKQFDNETVINTVSKMGVPLSFIWKTKHRWTLSDE